MNEEIDDTGAILQDFTAVSDWEILILRIEEIIQEWKLAKKVKEPTLQNGDFRNSTWEITKENIESGNNNLSLIRYKMTVKKSDKSIDYGIDSLDDSGKHCQTMIDLAVNENDFDKLGPSLIHIPLLATWFGLRDFVVVTSNTHRNIKGYDVRLLLSSINIAINNTGCEIPIFIQCLEPWQQFYFGICEYKDLCIKFDTIHLQKTPSQCQYLIGLLDIFKGKVASVLPLDTVQISAKFSYTLADFASPVWMQQPPDFEFLQGKTLGISNYSTLPFGTTLDPVKNLHLYVSWFKLSEDTVVDSPSYTDFDPLLAPSWCLSLEFVEKLPALLYKFYEDFINLDKNQLTLKMFLNEGQVSEPVTGSLRIPKSALRSSHKTAGEPYLKESKYYNSLPYEIMKSILSFLFMESKSDIEIMDKNSVFVLGGDALKAGQNRDLSWRLAVVSAHVSQVMGDAQALAHIWYEFSQEMRCRWDSAINIEGVIDGFPNSRTCLLHQKLQMLNVCIDRRKARDATAVTNDNAVQETSSESEDEFFECSDDENGSDSAQEYKKHSLWNRPVGRLAKFGNQKLLESGDQMYIPVTQEPVPKTEDQLEQDAEVMLTLETGPNRSETIARIMSASLLSDMESFKAANPGAIFEDFIRWYSPRDWIEEDETNSDGQKKGHLSARMLIPDNMWIDVWKSAKPVPAKRQRRLFDDTKEAEKILHFFESRSVAQIVELLLPSLTQAVIEKLGQECENKPELLHLDALFDRLKTCATKLTRERADAEKYRTLADQMYKIEVLIARLISIKLKLEYSSETSLLDDAKKFVSELLIDGEADVPGGSRGQVGTKVISLFRGAIEDRSSGTPAPRESFFPAPVEKEFVLRVMASRPSASSAPSLQFMRAVLKHNSLRILGAFTEDTTFA